MERLASPEAALALIIAPAGYGKSTLLAEWAETDARPFVWLSLAEDVPWATSALTSRCSSGRCEALPGLVRDLRSRHKTFVLVLEDAHLVPADDLGEAVGRALGELPCGATIALASRTEPRLPSGRLRAHRLLSEVREPQLAMNCVEAAALFRQVGLEPDFQDVQTLVRRTEGWPAALYLAALALREDPGAAASFGGQHHLLAEYLRDEVLAALTPDMLSFALRTSVLDELAGPICDRLLERHDSAGVLEELTRVSPLLMPLDCTHQRYRWHTLVHEALGAQLERHDPEIDAALRLRASDLYARSGDTSRAIDHAAAAGDGELTENLLWRNILMYLMTGHNDLVRGWLTKFSPDQIASQAPLALSAAFNALVGGSLQEAQRWSVAAEAALPQAQPRSIVESLSTGLTVLEAITVYDGAGRMGDLARAAAERDSDHSPWQPVCVMLEGIAGYLQGDLGAAEVLLEQSIKLSGSRAPLTASLCLAERAMIALGRGDWELAADLTDRASSIVDESGLAADPMSALTFAAAAASRAHDGRIDEAKLDLRSGVDLLTALGDFVPWYGAQARILLAHASLWLADAVRARTLLAEASRLARRTSGAKIFAEWFDRAWAYMDTLAESSLAGPSSLTIAELRILRFLPSHRSFREIAAQLGVSANTVKTQAHAVYRKLGAASRSEAVAQAMDLGLLGQ